MRNQEHREQVAVFKWAQLREATCPALKWMFAVPNGAKRDPVTGALLKAEGVRRGVPDTFLPVPMGGFSGLAIEMKAKGGRVSPEQKEWLKALQSHGWRAVVCFGAADAIKVIENYIGGMQ